MLVIILKLHGILENHNIMQNNLNDFDWNLGVVKILFPE